MFLFSNPAICNLEMFFKNRYHMTEQEAKSLCWILNEMIVWGCELSDVMDKADEIFTFTDEKEIETFAKKIIEVWNNTRMLTNRGFTPNELRNRGEETEDYLQPEIYYEEENDFDFFDLEETAGKVIPFKRDEKKTYPNDSCPCGSGKKHKHCCGKKQ